MPWAQPVSPAPGGSSLSLSRQRPLSSGSQGGCSSLSSRTLCGSPGLQMFFSKGIQAFTVKNSVNTERLDARKMKMEEGKAQVFAAGRVGQGLGVVGAGKMPRWPLLSHWCVDLVAWRDRRGRSLGSFTSILYSGCPNPQDPGVLRLLWGGQDGWSRLCLEAWILF